MSADTQKSKVSGVLKLTLKGLSYGGKILCRKKNSVMLFEVEELPTSILIFYWNFLSNLLLTNILLDLRNVTSEKSIFKLRYSFNMFLFKPFPTITRIKLVLSGKGLHLPNFPIIGTY